MTWSAPVAATRALPLDLPRSEAPKPPVVNTPKEKRPGSFMCTVAFFVSHLFPHRDVVCIPSGLSARSCQSVCGGHSFAVCSSGRNASPSSPRHRIPGAFPIRPTKHTSRLPDASFASMAGGITLPAAPTCPTDGNFWLHGSVWNRSKVTPPFFRNIPIPSWG